MAPFAGSAANVRALPEGILGDDRAKIVGRAEDYLWAAAEFLFCALLNLLRNARQVTHRTFEDHIAALHVGLRLCKFQRHEKLT
jgi:hypothetical protein